MCYLQQYCEEVHANIPILNSKKLIYKDVKQQKKITNLGVGKSLFKSKQSGFRVCVGRLEPPLFQDGSFPEAFR